MSVCVFCNIGFSILHLMHCLTSFLLVSRLKLLVSLFHFSFEQLKMAVTHLKRQANKKSEGSLAYVKGGLSTFFEAQDALSGKVTPPSHLLGLPQQKPDTVFAECLQGVTFGLYL